MEDDNIVENDKNIASTLNEFFSNTITALGIPQYNETETVSHNIGDPLVKAVMKYRFYPSIVAIKKSFSLNVMKSWKKLITLTTNNTTLSTDIPTKRIKENSDIFGDFIFGNYNNCVSYSIFPNSLKNATTKPVQKKVAKTYRHDYRKMKN